MKTFSEIIAWIEKPMKRRLKDQEKALCKNLILAESSLQGLTDISLHNPLIIVSKMKLILETHTTLTFYLGFQIYQEGFLSIHKHHNAPLTKSHGIVYTVRTTPPKHPDQAILWAVGDLLDFSYLKHGAKPYPPYDADISLDLKMWGLV